MVCHKCPFLKFVGLNGDGFSEPLCSLGGATLDKEDLDIKQWCIADLLLHEARKRAADGAQRVVFSPLQQRAIGNAYSSVSRATYHLAELLHVEPMDISRFARRNGLLHRRRQSPHWQPTTAELEAVKQLYSSVGPVRLAPQLGVTVSQLTRQARKLELVKSAKRRWSAAERVEFVRLSPQMSPAALATHLGRTPTALLIKRKRWKVKCRQGWQLCDVCRLVGYDHHALRPAIVCGLLKGVYVRCRSDGLGWWHFTADAVAAFLLAWERTDPLRIDLRSLDQLMQEVSDSLQRQLAPLREKVADVVRYQVADNRKHHKTHIVERLRQHGFRVYHYNGVIATTAQPSDIRALFTPPVRARLKCVPVKAAPANSRKEKLSNGCHDGPQTTRNLSR